jgi:hypothetical protein
VTSTPAGTPRSDALRTALGRLADGSARTGRDRSGRCIDDAEAAVTDVRDAAAFVADGRLPDLALAVGAADAAGDGERARRGREALATLRRLRAAVASDPDDRSPAASDPDRAADPPPTAEYFDSARGTVLGRTGQPHDR